MKKQLTTLGAAVVSSARKLVFKVPAGPVVGFPEGAAISKYGQNNESPVIVVLNHVDKSMGDGGCWQGADTENGIVIMNNVPEDAANELLDLFEANPTVDGLEDVIARAEALGCLDNYTTKVSFADDNLTPAGRMLGKYTGIVKRDSKDVAKVGRGPDGVIYRLLGDDVKHIDTDEILVRDYRNADGSMINASTLPLIQLEDEAEAS